MLPPSGPVLLLASPLACESGSLLSFPATRHGVEGGICGAGRGFQPGVLWWPRREAEVWCGVGLPSWHGAPWRLLVPLPLGPCV